MSNRSDTSSKLHVATLGRSVGLKGDMKLHIKSDFPEQFVPGASFTTQTNETLVIESVNFERGTVRLRGFSSPEAIKRLTNAKLFTTFEATRETCELEEGEFFWFDVIGCEVFESGTRLGVVSEIERIAERDYLEIKTDEKLVSQNFAKRFLVPYQDPFILETDIKAKRIEVKGAVDLLEAS